jgi:integrase
VSVHRYTTKDGTIRYRVMWRDDAGKQRSKTVKSKAEARILDAKARLGTAPSSGKGPTIGEWLVDWFRLYSSEWSITTLRQRKGDCDKWIFPHISNVHLSTMNRRAILEYRKQLQDSGATDKTVNKVISVLSAALTAAVNEGLIDHNAARGMSKLKTAPTSRRALKPLEVELIRHWMPTERDRVIVSLLAYGGLRPGELVALHWRHITEHHIFVEQSAQAGMIQHTKTGKARNVPVNPVLAEDLDAYGRGLPDSLVVCGERGGILHWKNWFRRVWVPAARTAGVKASPYDLRHTFVSLLLHSGATIPEVSAWVGHANAAMTLNVYAHVYAEAQRSTRLPVEQAIRDARTELVERRQRVQTSRAELLAEA